MTGRSYWQIRIDRVTDVDGRMPEINPATLTTYFSETVGDGSDDPPLPRAGQEFWLVSDEDFRRLTETEQ